MWHWDQGRLDYFQFDNLCVTARFVVDHDFKAATRTQLQALTGLPFSVPATHTPWRNYSRVLKQSLLVSERNGVAEPTPVAALLAKAGSVTSDEYLHFLISASTEPNPALQDWSNQGLHRFPLLFSLKYLLAKSAVGREEVTSDNEIIGAYRSSNFVGSEDQNQFIQLLSLSDGFAKQGASSPGNLRRQARESFRILCQVSYLFRSRKGITTALARQDAEDIFGALFAIGGPRDADGNAEIRRLAQLFSGGSTLDIFDFPHTVVSSVADSGFAEGTKVEKTHVTIERNAKLRTAYFASRPTSVCDVCIMDTQATYHWTERVLDLHHLLPLASGMRVESTGTTFADLVPLCPTCHRAVHRYYGDYLRTSKQRDFASRDEAHGVYANVKQAFQGIISA